MAFIFIECICAVIFGVLSVLLLKPMLVIVTSLIGGVFVAVGADLLAIHSVLPRLIFIIFKMRKIPAPIYDWRLLVALGLFIIVACLGLIVQFKVTAKKQIYRAKVLGGLDDDHPLIQGKHR